MTSFVDTVLDMYAYVCLGRGGAWVIINRLCFVPISK